MGADECVGRRYFHGKFEVIVIDNGSTDEIYQVASGSEGVKVVRESRKGVQFAREGMS